MLEARGECKEFVYILICFGGISILSFQINLRTVVITAVALDVYVSKFSHSLLLAACPCLRLTGPQPFCFFLKTLFQNLNLLLHSLLISNDIDSVDCVLVYMSSFSIVLAI